MISPKTRQLLEELAKLNYGRALVEYLNEELKTIDTVKGVKSFEEARSRELAVELIEKLFSFLKSNPQGSGNKKLYS